MVPTAGVEGVDHHVRNARGKHHTGHLVHKLSFKLMDELLDKVDRCHLHGNEFFHQHMPIHNAGDWARERAGRGAEALQRRIALRGGTELSGIVICLPRIATRQ